MPKRTALCVSSLHRTPLARYPAIGQQPACPFARDVRPPEDPAIRHLSEPRANTASVRSSIGRAVDAVGRAPRRRHRDLHASADARARGVDRVAGPDGQHRSTDPVRTTAGTFLAAGSARPADAQFTYDIPVTATTASPGRGASSAIGERQWNGSRAVSLDRPPCVVQRHRSPRRGRHPWRRHWYPPRTSSTPARRVCCTTPSNGFDYSGAASFTVQAGDKYGFVLHGSNGDFNDLLRGELTVGDGPQVVHRRPGPLPPYIRR